jgi:hypothetical protein
MAARKKEKEKPDPSPVHSKRMATQLRNRQNRHFIQGESARESIGKLEKGMDLFGITKGQFSLVNLIEECLKQTGPAHLDISTWTIAHAEVLDLIRWKETGLITGLRYFTDHSFIHRTNGPERAGLILEAFGAGTIRATKNHAKFILIENDDWSLVITSSMNLNENRRLEVFTLTESKDMADYLRQVIDDFFAEAVSWDRATFDQWPRATKEEKLQALVRSKMSSDPGADAILGAPDWDADLDL